MHNPFLSFLWNVSVLHYVWLQLRLWFILISFYDLTLHLLEKRHTHTRTLDCTSIKTRVLAKALKCFLLCERCENISFAQIISTFSAPQERGWVMSQKKGKQ